MSKYDKEQHDKGGEVRSLGEIVFSLNVAAAAGYALLVHISKNVLKPMDDSTYYFIRSAFRIADFLQLRSVRAVSTSSAAGEARWGYIGEELVVVLTTAGVAALLVLSLRLVARTSVYRTMLSRVALVTALFAAPICYLYALKLTWGLVDHSVIVWSSEKARPITLTSSLPLSFWQSFPFLSFAAEVACLCVFVALFKKRTPSNWVSVPFLVLHYSFWIAIFWGEVRVWGHTVFAHYLLLILFPVSAFVWIHYHESLSEPQEEIYGNLAGKWTWLVAVTALATLWTVWIPSRTHRLSPPQNLNSVTIQLSRGSGFSACASSHITTVHGNGEIEREERQQRGITRQEFASIRPEQVLAILQILDRVHFMSLDDRAFSSGLDTSDVEILVSIDGSTKRVQSDSMVPSAGHQAKFVKAAAEIDEIVGFFSWVNCRGRNLN